jgi:multidrug transporter EmrE-like cation transporter
MTPEAKEHFSKLHCFFSRNKNVFKLHFSFFLFTLAGISAKKASSFSFFSSDFFAFYSLEIIFILTYAFIWQQVLKNIDLSIAYLNKSSTFIWTFIWAVVLFHETITIPNVIGVAIIIFGIVLVFKNE